MLMCKPRCKFLVSTFFQIVANIIRCRERFFVLSRAWDREKILSLHKESNLRTSDSALRCATTEPQRFYCRRDLLRSSQDTPSCTLLGSACVDKVMFLDRIREMASFGL